MENRARYSQYQGPENFDNISYDANFSSGYFPPRDDVSLKQMRDMIRWMNLKRLWESTIILTIGLGIISLFGSLGNGLVAYVFGKKLRSRQCSGLIALLGLIDFIIAFVDIPVTIYMQIWLQDTLDFICRLQGALKAFCIPLSALILVLIALERYLLICFVPAKSLHENTVKLILFAVFIFAAVQAVPWGLAVGVKGTPPLSKNSPRINERLGNSSVTSLPLNQVNDERFKWGMCDKEFSYISGDIFSAYLMGTFVMFIIIFICLCVLYSSIFYFIIKRQLLREKKLFTKSVETTRITENEQAQNQLITENHGIEEENNESSQNQVAMPLLQLQDEVFHESPHKTDKNYVPRNRDSSAKKAKLSTTSSSTRSRRDRMHVRTAITLALVTITFLISYLPYFLIATRFIFNEAPSQSPASYDYSHKLLNRKRIVFHFYYFSILINPIIYACMNQAFRKEVINIFSSTCVRQIFRG